MKRKYRIRKYGCDFFNALFHNVLMGVELYNLQQIKDNFIIFQSYMTSLSLNQQKNGGKSVWNGQVSNFDRDIVFSRMVLLTCGSSIVGLFYNS